MDHNKWNYIYFLIYLDRKSKNDLTALEKQIADDNKVREHYSVHVTLYNVLYYV